MATFKICVQKQRKDGFYPVYIRVVHNRAVGYISTGKMVTAEWVSRSKDVTEPFITQQLSSRIIDYNNRLNRKDTMRWDVKAVIDFLRHGDEDLCFSDFARGYIDKLIDNGQPRSARNYRMALNSLELYAGTTKVMFSALTSQFVGLWIKSLAHTARAKEMYPICMRQVFKAAVMEFNDYDNDVIRIRTNPWLKVTIPNSDRPEKLAISAEACREFFNAPLPPSKMVKPKPELGRDVAMMVLCLAGINTVDLFHLQKRDCLDGIIRYKRAKTTKYRADKAYMEMRVPEILKPIMAKYATDDSDPYLLDFHNRFSSSDSFGANVNAGIKDVCELSLGMDRKDAYCVYTFRHTFATIAQNDCGASIDEVGFALNHSRGRNVTRGYIRISYAPAWELNQKVVDFVFGGDRESAACESDGDGLFRMSVRHQIEGTATYQDRVIAKISDIGFSNVKQVIVKLAAMLPVDIPQRAVVSFRIENLDKRQAVTYEKMKGRGFF